MAVFSKLQNFFRDGVVREVLITVMEDVECVGKQERMTAEDLKASISSRARSPSPRKQKAVAVHPDEEQNMEFKHMRLSSSPSN
jgi:hypothetical protein